MAEVRCPECRSADVTSVDNYAGNRGVTLHQCNECGYEWKGS